jgi:hypothetical protein
LQLLCVVPVSFGVGLRANCLLSGDLRVAVLTIRFIALPNGIGLRISGSLS